MRSWIVAVLASGLTAVGCAGNPQPDASGTLKAAESSAGPAAVAPSPGPPPVDGSTGGTMIPFYGDAQSPQAVNGRALIQGDRLL